MILLKFAWKTIYAAEKENPLMIEICRKMICKKLEQFVIRLLAIGS